MEIVKKKRSSGALDNTKAYKLSAFLDVDSFFYAITDRDDQLTISDEIPTNHLSSDTAMPDVKIGQAKIGLLNNLFTIIPASEYEPDILSSLVNHAIDTSLREKYIYKADYHAAADAYVCYAIPQHLYKLCFKVHQLPHLYHGVFALLTDALGHKGENVIHLCRQDDEVVMIVSKDGKLLAANNFVAKSSLSTLYYSSLLSQTLDLDASDTIIELSGDFIQGGEDAKLISRYFGALRHADSNYTFDGMSIDHSSLFFPLQSVARCA